MVKKKVDAAGEVAQHKIPVFMLRGGNWITPSGVMFSKGQPYQLVEWTEAIALTEHDPDRFRIAEADEIREFYGIKSD